MRLPHRRCRSRSASAGEFLAPQYPKFGTHRRLHVRPRFRSAPDRRHSTISRVSLRHEENCTPTRVPVFLSSLLARERAWATSANSRRRGIGKNDRSETHRVRTRTTRGRRSQKNSNRPKCLQSTLERSPLNRWASSFAVQPVYLGSSSSVIQLDVKILSRGLYNEGWPKRCRSSEARTRAMRTSSFGSSRSCVESGRRPRRSCD